MKRPLAEVIVVSGASSGVGRAVARAAGARGAKVVVAARSGAALDAAVVEIDAAGGEGLAVPGEVTSEADAEKLLWGQKLSPRAGDLVLLRTGWKGQTTGEPKPVDSPDNLWAPLPGDPGAHGRFDDRARTSSAWTAARLRLGKRGSVTALVGSALATLIGYHRLTKRGQRRSK